MITENAANLINLMLAEKHGSQWSKQLTIDEIEKAKK